MNIWIRAIALSAVGSLFAVPNGPAFAAAECFTVGLAENSGEKLNLDPARNLGMDNAVYVNSIYDSLVDLDNSFGLLPRLATSWKSNADATQWTFKLREGVKFHDGSDFDSADVVYTFKRLLDKKVGSPGLKQLAVLETARIEAVDAHTVRFTTDKPVAQLPLSIKNRFTLIVPEGATTEGMESHAIGTGAFTIKDFDKSAPFNIITRNPNYWAPGLPKAECIKVISVLDPIARAAALMTKEADMTPSIDPRLLPVLRKNKDITLLVSPGGGSSRNLTMQIDTPPFDDIRVRQAIKLIVDRQAVVDGPFMGAGEVGNDNPIPLSSDLAYTNVAPKQDIAKAKQLLAEAGYADGLELELYVHATGTGYLGVAQAFVPMAAEAGVTVKIKQVPGNAFWSETWLKVPFSVTSWSARPPGTALAVAYRKGAKWNETHWYRDDYDALLDRAEATLDDEERIALWKQAQKMLTEEGGAVFVAFYKHVAAIRNDCSGYAPHATLFYADFREVTCTR